MLRASHTLSAIVLASLAAMVAPAHAQFGGGGAPVPVTVSATGTDLVDTTVGQDLWRFDFTVSGQMNTFDVLSIAIDGRFGSPLSLTTGVLGQYGAAVVPNVFGTAEFLFTDLGTTATTNSFAFTANRLAGLLPSSLTTLTTKYNNAFMAATPLTMGAALPPTPVPEASTTAMLAAGLAAMGFMVRRRRQG